MRQVAAVVGVEQGIRRTVGLAGDPVGYIDPNRMPAGHDAGACRTADGAGGVPLCEPHTAPGQVIDVRCFVISATVCPDVCPAHVVHKKEHKVGLLGSGKRWCCCNEKAKDAESEREEWRCFFHC